MVYIKVHLHCIWSTKDRVPFLSTKEIRTQVWQHIKENAKHKGIYVDFINGYSEHCHCLISLGVDQTISKVLQLIKGESSFWINRNVEPFSGASAKFEWQEEYFAVSVSESMLERVRTYIQNQEEHHKVKTFEEEYDKLMSTYGFDKFG